MFYKVSYSTNFRSTVLALISPIFFKFMPSSLYFFNFFFLRLYINSLFMSAQSLSEYGTPFFVPILDYHTQSSFKDVTICSDVMLWRIFSSKMYFEGYCCLPSTKGVSSTMSPLYLTLFHERIIVNIGLTVLIKEPLWHYTEIEIALRISYQTVNGRQVQDFSTFIHNQRIEKLGDLRSASGFDRLETSLSNTKKELRKLWYHPDRECRDGVRLQTLRGPGPTD